MGKDNKVININRFARPVVFKDMNQIMKEREEKREEIKKRMKEIWKRK
ncbi:hypothetical protein [Aneurinibacillus tyrosinisolvens]|nr:hypothetical protein [Aneurinibacillus tyrosinisolvens]